MSNQEKDSFSSHEQFNSKNLEAVREQQQERIKEDLERGVEKNPEKRVESARKEALETASQVEKERNKHEKKESSPAERRGPASKKEREASFDSTMREVRSHMSAPSRAFSKVIHNPAVEKTSDALGNTVARPNAILSGSLFAFLFTLAVYLIARYSGYPLSGTETIASFILGWVLGLIYDYVRLLVLGRSR